MNEILTHFRSAWRDEIALGASAEVGRVFVRCKGCSRVIPAWQMVNAAPKPGDLIGCACGHPFSAIVRLGSRRAAWWVMRCYLWRKLLLRKANWDPRLPWRINR